MKLLQTLGLFALVNCCTTKGIEECVQMKNMSSSRKFPIIQLIDQTLNKTINTFNDSAMQHLRSEVTTVLIPCFYLMVLIIGLPANGLALWVLVTRIKKLSSTIFLMNLALADLLLTLSLPFKISYHLLGNDWVFGEGLCRGSSALFYGNVYSSTLLLTCISADRYLGVVHPFLSKELRSKKSVYCVCGVVWVLVVLSMVPLYITNQSYKIHTLNITTCNDALLEKTMNGYIFYYFICLVVFGFVIPCLISVFCYVSVISTLILNDEKYVHVIKVTVLVLLVFLVCLTPFNVILLIQVPTHSSDLYFYYMICLALSTFNNCIDPFIYYYISEEFRDKVRSTICAPKNKANSEKSAQSLIQSSSLSQSRPPQAV
ncbi:proteinase-activated receptor 3-like [Heptranchias perlo]|uniref:proteinase-activated receptor 3-like n=1 Tax=Heptranchias perlo TaxID=212740 RepID=UPI00355A9E5C